MKLIRGPHPGQPRLKAFITIKWYVAFVKESEKLLGAKADRGRGGPASRDMPAGLLTHQQVFPAHVADLLLTASILYGKSRLPREAKAPRKAATSVVLWKH